MRRTLVIGFGLAMIAVALIQPTPAVAQIATIIETQVPERPIPPPPEVRGREHRAKTNPYFGLRSSFQNVRQYYPVYPYRQPAWNPYGYGYGWRYRW